jgi:hypothetical protein
VVVEGVVLFDDEPITPEESYKVANVVVDVGDGNVTMEAANGEAYTMLNWMSIEPVD